MNNGSTHLEWARRFAPENVGQTWASVQAGLQAVVVKARAQNGAIYLGKLALRSISWGRR